MRKPFMHLAVLDAMTIDDLNTFLDAHIIPVQSVDCEWWSDYKSRFESMNPGSKLVFLQALLPNFFDRRLPNTAETRERIEQGEFSRWSGIRVVCTPS